MRRVEPPPPLLLRRKAEELEGPCMKGRGLRFTLGTPQCDADFKLEADARRSRGQGLLAELSTNCESRGSDATVTLQFQSSPRNPGSPWTAAASILRLAWKWTSSRRSATSKQSRPPKTHSWSHVTQTTDPQTHQRPENFFCVFLMNDRK